MFDDELRESAVPNVFPERRKHPRYPASSFRLWMGRWDEEEFEIEATRLLDISRGGAALIALDAPPIGEMVWLCLHDAPRTGSVRASVIGVHADDVEGYVVRLMFGEPIPDALFEAAVGLLQEV
jgi:hypothetical protein